MSDRRRINHVVKNKLNPKVVLCNVCMTASDSTITGVVTSTYLMQRFAYCGKCVTHMYELIIAKNKLPISTIDEENDDEQWMTATDES